MEPAILISVNKSKRKEGFKMKEILKATVLMAVIIAVQMVLSYAFTYHVAEVFSRVSVTFLLYYYVFKAAKVHGRAAAAK